MQTRKTQMEFSKVVVKYTGIFTAIHTIANTALVCIFPDSAGTLLSLSMTVTAGCMTVFSWYFGKALGENKLKISQGISTYHQTVSNLGSTIINTITDTDSYSDTGNG